MGFAVFQWEVGLWGIHDDGVCCLWTAHPKSDVVSPSGSSLHGGAHLVLTRQMHVETVEKAILADVLAYHVHHAWVMVYCL